MEPILNVSNSYFNYMPVEHVHVTVSIFFFFCELEWRVACYCVLRHWASESLNELTCLLKHAEFSISQHFGQIFLPDFFYFLLHAQAPDRVMIVCHHIVFLGLFVFLFFLFYFYFF